MKLQHLAMLISLRLQDRLFLTSAMTELNMALTVQLVPLLRLLTNSRLILRKGVNDGYENREARR